jgi:hypothetical protein
MVKNFHLFTNEDGNYLNKIRNQFPYFSDFLSLFLEDESGGSRYLYEIIKEIKAYNPPLEEHWFYKSLLRMWKRYKDNYIGYFNEINSEVSDLIDKYNERKIKENIRKENIFKFSIRRGTKRFGDLTINYELSPPKHTASFLKLVRDGKVKMTDKTRLLSILDYKIDDKEIDFPDENADDIETKNFWKNFNDKYMSQIEEWADKNEYYLWGY